MRQLPGLLTFLVIFHTLYFGMNLYVLLRLGNLFGIKSNWYFYTACAILSLSLFAGIVLEATISNAFSRITYILTASWMGVLFLLFWLLLAYEITRLFVHVNPHRAGVVIIITAAALTAYAMVNAQIIHTKVIKIPSPVDMDIVQLSDIHLGSVSERFLKRIVDKTNKLNPDVVLITGDLLDSHARFTPRSVATLNELAGPVFLVTGNHEGYIGAAKVKRLLEATKVRLLCNEITNLKDIQIVGINDSGDKEQVAKTLKKMTVNKSQFSVLMYHRPVGLQAASEAGVDLMLSGHTHNGQIFPFNFIVRLVYKHMKGFFRHNGAYLYVSTGTGTWGPRMRLGTTSEIVTVQLRKN